MLQHDEARGGINGGCGPVAKCCTSWLPRRRSCGRAREEGGREVRDGRKLSGDAEQVGRERLAAMVELRVDGVVGSPFTSSWRPRRRPWTRHRCRLRERERSVSSSSSTTTRTRGDAPVLPPSRSVKREPCERRRGVRRGLGMGRVDSGEDAPARDRSGGRACQRDLRVESWVSGCSLQARTISTHCSCRPA